MSLPAAEAVDVFAGSVDGVVETVLRLESRTR